MVWKRPWALLIPILFDGLIWILPRLGLTQLFRPYVNQMLALAAMSSDPQTLQETRASLEQMVNSFNLLGLVATALNAVTRLPTLLAVDAAQVTSPVNAWAFSLQLQEPLLVILLFIPLFLLGLLGVAFYLEWIAQGARPLEAPAPGRALLRVFKLWLRLIFFALLLLAFLLLAGLALLLLQVFFGSPELVGFATLLTTVGLFWLFIYFFFVPSAMAVSDIGLVQAIRRSTLLFRVFFWATLALVALSVFLDRGLAIVWTGFTVSAVGVVLGIVANAYIGTALLAASMVYYQDRLNVFEHARKAVKK